MTEEVAPIEGEEVPAVEPVSTESETQEAPTGEHVENTEAKAEGEEATASEDAEKAEAHKKKGGVQKRIDELTRQRYEAEQRATQAEQREAQYRRQAFQESHESSKPTLEQYSFDQDAWAGAYEQWVQVGNQKAGQEQQAFQQQARQQQAQAVKQQTITEKAYKAQEKYPDFFAKIQDPSLPSLQKISPAAFDAVVDSPNMGDLAYYMANNPQEVYRLGQLPPVRAITEVARLEARITAKPAATPPPPPPPPGKLKGRNDAVVDPNKMDINDWMRWRNSQVNSR